MILSRMLASDVTSGANVQGTESKGALRQRFSFIVFCFCTFKFGIWSPNAAQVSCASCINIYHICSYHFIINIFAAFYALKLNAHLFDPNQQYHIKCTFILISTKWQVFSNKILHIDSIALYNVYIIYLYIDIRNL